MTAGLPEFEERIQEVVHGRPVNHGEPHGQVGKLPDFGHGVPGAVDVLATVEMLLHRREREPVGFLFL